MLVLIDLLDEKPEAAVKTAEEAFAAWDLPAAKEQEEKFPTVRTRRNRARSEVTLWRADALAKLGRQKEVISTLAEWDARFPDARAPYPTYAYERLIAAHLDEKDLDTADRLYRVLLQRDPSYAGLAQITFKFADYYNAQRKVIDDELRTVRISLNDKTRAFRTAEKEYHSLAATLADLQKLKSKLDAALALKKEQDAMEARGQKPTQAVNPDLLGQALEEERTHDIKNRIDGMTPRIQELRATMAGLEKEIGELSTKRHDLEQRIYEPLTRSASYYKAWDDALKTLEASEAGDASGKSYRTPDNMFVFGTLFLTAARLRPEVPGNWESARTFFEDYLSDARVKAKPSTDPELRTAIARLGEVLVSLAEAEQDPEKRRPLVTKAVDLLQSAIANDPADNELAVALLSNKVMVLSWKDREADTVWRFPIARPATVEELRSAVKGLDSADAPFQRRRDDAQAKREWQAALAKFRRELDRMDNGQLQKWIDASASGFDGVLYRQVANADSDFRLTLAWAYARTGRQEDLPKAQNLAVSLVRGPIQVEDASEGWWRAYGILFDLYLDAADRGLGVSPPSADAVQWLESAGKVILGLASSDSQFGEEAADGNKQRWLARFDRLNGARTRAGLPRIALGAPEPAAPPSEGR